MSYHLTVLLLLIVRSTCRLDLQYFSGACIELNLYRKIRLPGPCLFAHYRRKGHIVNVISQFHTKLPALIVFSKSLKGLDSDIVGSLGRKELLPSISG